MRPVRPLLALLLLASPLRAQEGTLDVLDGETLYDGGWLVTLGFDEERRKGLISGEDSVPDPLSQERIDRTAVLAAHWGARHDLQLSAILPYVDRSLEGDGGLDEESRGLGDAGLVAKWRFYRWDAPSKALNVAVMAGLELPTGSDDETDGGTTLPPDLQPGSGSWDPLLGLAATYEPGRWRFNAVALAKWNTPNDDGYRFGNDFVAELEAGNRFWLEPYPGPFMRLDGRVRYFSEGRDQDGGAVPDTGGERASVGATLAFRPRPSLDFQLGYDVVVWEDVEGTQLAHDSILAFTIGLRF
jgi:Putative MetA-pathway of phenol degradation